MYKDSSDNYPNLSNSEITALFRRYKEEDDDSARELLILSFFRLASKIARAYRVTSPLPYEDIVQEALVAIIRAIDCFDYKRGIRFMTYAYIACKNAIINAQDEQSKIIRIPEYILRLQREIEIADPLEEMSYEELAKKLSSSVTRIKYAKNWPSCTSLEKILTPFGEINDLSAEEANYALWGIPSDPAQAATDRLTLETALSCLNEREKRILYRTEILEHTQRVVAIDEEISYERVRQIRNIALAKSRKHYESVAGAEL